MLDKVDSLFYNTSLYAASAVAFFNLLLLTAIVAVAAWAISVFLDKFAPKPGSVNDASYGAKRAISFWMASLVALVGGYFGYIAAASGETILLIAIFPAINFLGVATFVYLYIKKIPLGGLPVYLFAFVSAVILASFASAYNREYYTKPRGILTEICTSISSNMHELTDREARIWVSGVFKDTCGAVTGINLKLNSETSEN